MDKNKWILGVAPVIFLLLAFNVYLYSQIQRKKSSGIAVTPPGLVITPGYQKVYGEGNSIIYDSFVPLTFHGSGYIHTTGKDESTVVEYIVGKFAGWENIPNSTDRYVLVKQYNTSQIYKARTTWSSNISSMTLLVKEDVSKIGSNRVEKGYLTRIGTIENQKELYKDRILIVLLKIDNKNKTALKDTASIPIADAIIVR